MKKNKEQTFNRPFEALSNMVKDKGLPLSQDVPNTEKPLAGQDAPTRELTRGLDDDKLFGVWMANVTPLSRDKLKGENNSPPLPNPEDTCQDDSDSQVLDELTSLVTEGSGFKMNQT
ncbi:MAG: hypothetical protein JEZ02_19595 [Desulfatibacillum sp.]|nr:hypothetical protein [Desulfatibacillum sp.]